jgi:F0F1-type ATP synthase assembly protein I
MGAIFGTIARILAGIGLAWLVDKFVPDPPVPKTEVSTWGIMKIVVLVVSIAAGALVLAFIGRKLKIKLLKG